MTCCRKQFTPSENKKKSKLKVLAGIYSQMRKGTDIKPGDWVRVRVGQGRFAPAYLMLYQGKHPIQQRRNIPWNNFRVLVKNEANEIVPKHQMPPHTARKISSFEIVPPFVEW